MPGRTDNDIENYWHVHLKKKFGKVNSRGVEGKQNFEDYKHYDDVATIGGLDYIKAYYDKMSAIAAHLPGRTHDDIKNYLYVHMKKKLGKVNSCGAEGTMNYEGNNHYDDVATVGGLD
ncbi:hypothetical protein ACET3Z_016438 [Daucus carota]